MSTGSCSLIASSEQAEKAFEHFIRTKGVTFYLLKKPLCLVDIGRRSIQKSLPSAGP